MKILYGILSVCFLMVSCERGFECEKGRIIGKYTARHGKVSEYIEIRADNTYTHYFKNDSLEVTDKNKWSTSYEKNVGCNIELYNFKWYLPEAQEQWGWLHSNIGGEQWTSFRIPRRGNEKKLMIHFAVDDPFGTFYKESK